MAADKSAKIKPPSGPQPTVKSPLSFADTLDPSLGSTQEAPPISLPIAAASGPAPGQIIGKYQLLELIGTGGMGFVYRAEDSKLRRQVAIKFLKETQASNSRSIQRFFQEAQIAGNLQHPHLAAIFDVGESEGSCYMVMELLNPVNVAQFIKKSGPLDWVEASKIIADCCSALGAAHEAGLIHRDIKPDNILCSVGGIAKLVDFGLVKTLAGDGLNLSQSGALHGTPIYMSPEQCRSLAVDARSDIYSLGITYYHLLVGEAPFRDEALLALLMAHTSTPTPDPRERIPTIPEGCVEIIKRATEKDPANRYQTTEEMELALMGLLPGRLSGKFRFLQKTEFPSASRPRDPLMITPLQRTPRSDERMPTPNSLTPATGAIAEQKPMPRRSWLQLAGGASVLGIVAAAGLISSRRWQKGAAGGQPPIRIGLLNSMTGTMAIRERAHTEATLLAIDELNAQGGLLGRPIEPIQSDGRSDWSMFVREAERLIAKENVVAVFSGSFSAARRAMLPLFEKRDHLLLHSGQHEGLEDSAPIIYTGAVPNQYAVPAVRWFVEKLGKRRFFLVGTDTIFPRALNTVLRDELQTLKVDVVGEAYALFAENDFALIIKEILAAKPDTIINSISGDSNVPFFRALHSAGIDADKTPVLSLAMGENELSDTAGITHSGNYLAACYFQAIDRPANHAFLRRFKARYGEYRVLGDVMEAAYATVHLWAKAVRVAGDDQPKRVRPALKRQSFDAPSGELRIDPSNNHAWKHSRLAKINTAGEVEIVYSSPDLQPPQPFPMSRTRSTWETFIGKIFWDYDLQWSNPKQPRGQE